MRAGCENATTLAAAGSEFVHGDPEVHDFALLLQEGKGPLPERTPFEIVTRACDEGWEAGCGSLAGFYLEGNQVPRDLSRAAALLESACAGGHALSCSNLGTMYKRGDGVAQDDDTALAYVKKACDLGMDRACTMLADCV